MGGISQEYRPVSLQTWLMMACFLEMRDANIFVVSSCPCWWFDDGSPSSVESPCSIDATEGRW